MSRKKPPAEQDVDSVAQWSHDEIRQALGDDDSNTAIEQMKRAERKRQRLLGSSDAVGFESARASSAMITDFLQKNLSVAKKVVRGGNKGAERAYGEPAARAASEHQRLEWYATKVRLTRGARRRFTDRDALKLPDCPPRLSPRTLRRLKRKHSALLEALLSS
jgi:hypothetical protein